MKASYPYAEDGYDVRGRRLPAIPVLWLELSVASSRLRGPCVIDTGFDGALYANEDLALLLEGVKPVGVASLYAVGEGEIRCELFRVEATLISEDGAPVLELGETTVYVPIYPEALSHEVIAGREILNKLTLKLDGKLVKVL